MLISIDILELRLRDYLLRAHVLERVASSQQHLYLNQDVHANIWIASQCTMANVHG